jgi:hypothetical protein
MSSSSVFYTISEWIAKLWPCIIADARNAAGKAPSYYMYYLIFNIIVVVIIIIDNELLSATIYFIDSFAN